MLRRHAVVVVEFVDATIRILLALVCRARAAADAARVRHMCAATANDEEVRPVFAKPVIVKRSEMI